MFRLIRNAVDLVRMLTTCDALEGELLISMSRIDRRMKTESYFGKFGFNFTTPGLDHC